MDNPKQGVTLLTELETFLNNLIQRIFPVWYATHAAREIQTQPMGQLNPTSFLSHRWMSLHSVLQSLNSSLESQGDDWKELITVLEKLLVENEYPRRLSISSIHGVEQSRFDEEWPNLKAYAAQCGRDTELPDFAAFLKAVKRAFPERQADEAPHRVVYREWDGRYYYINQEEPYDLAAAQLYAEQHQCDSSVNVTINVESINSKALDKLRHEYWLLLLKRDSAYWLHDLIARANLPVAIAEFEWRRSDLSFLVGRKSDRRINRIFLNLLSNRSSQEVLDFGSYIARQHFPFRNQ